MQFMTREVFDTLIIAVIIIGGALAAVRLYKDLTRPLPQRFDDWPDYPRDAGLPPVDNDEDTRPNRPVNPMDT